MPDSLADNPSHWRERAEQARRVAEHLTDATARAHMISCAQAYERLAALAAKQHAETPASA